MGRLSERDLRHITGFLHLPAPGTRTDPLPRPLLVGLRDLLGADDAEFFELRRTDRALLAGARSHDWPEPAWVAEALAVYGSENPLNWRRWRPSDGAMRLSARIARRDLNRLGFYREIMRPLGLTDTLKVWLASTETSAACVQLWRHSAEFTRRDEDILGVLQSHLVQIRTDAMAAPRAPGHVPDAHLTPREAEILTWAGRGESDAAIGGRLRTSEATIGKHLEHAYEKLGVHSRSEALWRISGPAIGAPSRSSKRS